MLLTQEVGFGCWRGFGQFYFLQSLEAKQGGVDTSVRNMVSYFKEFLDHVDKFE